MDQTFNQDQRTLDQLLAERARGALRPTRKKPTAGATWRWAKGRCAFFSRPIREGDGAIIGRRGTLTRKLVTAPLFWLRGRPWSRPISSAATYLFWPVRAPVPRCGLSRAGTPRGSCRKSRPTTGLGSYFELLAQAEQVGVVNDGTSNDVTSFDDAPPRRTRYKITNYLAKFLLKTTEPNNEFCRLPCVVKVYVAGARVIGQTLDFRDGN